MGNSPQFFPRKSFSSPALPIPIPAGRTPGTTPVAWESKRIHPTSKHPRACADKPGELRSSRAGAARNEPRTSSLANGELKINPQDKRLHSVIKLPVSSERGGSRQNKTRNVSNISRFFAGGPSSQTHRGEKKKPTPKPGCHSSDVSAIRNCVSGDRTTNFPENFPDSAQKLHPSSSALVVSTAELFPGDGKNPAPVNPGSTTSGFKPHPATLGFGRRQRGRVGFSLPVFLGSSQLYPWIFCCLWRRSGAATDHREPSSWNSSSSSSSRLPTRVRVPAAGKASEGS